MSSTAKPAKPDDSTTGRHIPALDGIRGLALLLVLMFHMLWSNPYVSGPWIVRVLARAHMYGWMGVDLFFVLSGFLITGILYDTLDDRHFFRNFYARRILRIFPLYYGFLLLVVVVTLATGHQVGWSTMVYFLTYTQSLVLHPVHALSTVPWINVNHFWSLAIEEQFYLMWPCAIFLLRTRRRIAIAAVCGALLSVLVRIICVHYGLNRMQPYIVYSWTPSHLDGLFLGGLLAMLVRSRCRETLLRFGPTLFGFALLGLILFDLRYSVNNFLVLDDPTAAVWGLLLVAVAAVTLVTATLKSGSVAQRVFAAPVLRFF
ncbi:MAG: acyltransferase, partial [Bryocella sp.]